MRIERVTAHAFGPLAGETLELAPGMTLVYGQNEAGKSSWHAALYAGLCGVRRGRGQPLLEDREFRELHKPWDGERWETEVLVRLADGRRVELRQDLAGKVACRAIDVSLGTDVSAEVMNDGTPDGSRWLGLDRRAFLATACVGQAELLEIAADPGLLQEHMQRAAATRGTDATAAEAIERLDEFRREQVGADTANSTKPLRRARRELEEAERALRDARDRHAAFLALSATADAAREQALAAEAELRALGAAVARVRAEATRARSDRAAELARRHPGGAPSGLVAGDELASRVAAAIDAWERRPTPIALAGPTADELELELRGLPIEPVGDLAPADEVVRAKAEYDRRREALRLVGERPAEPSRPVTGGLAEDELRELARRLETVIPAAPVSMPSAVQGTAGLAGAGARFAGGAVVGAVVLAIGGLVALGSSTLVGGILLVAAVILGGAAFLALQARGRAPGATEAGARQVIGTEAYALQAALAEVASATARATGTGLPADPAALRSLAGELAGARLQEARLAEWSRLDEERGAAHQAAEAILGELLRARAVSLSNGLEAAYEAYLADCRTRAGLARDASRGPGLRAAIETRRGLERNAAEAAGRIASAEADLRRIAAEIGTEGLEAADAVEVVAGLRAWQRRRTAEVSATEAALGEWRELETLLGGGTPPELRAEADRLADRAGELARGLDPAAIQAAAAGPDPEGRSATLEGRAAALRADADRAAGQLAEVERRLPSVAEAEERAEAAAAELDRVKRLDAVLGHTLRLLRQAEERVHRDLAPVLGGSIAARLPRVSGGRYLDAAVNPADLAVRVKAADGGHWRDARRLSHGTREQIYLLLRLAMTEQLVRAGEVAPLICDEVTVQSDERRARELLDLLHDLSAERQVVVFTHDERALAWARQRLDGADDRLVELRPPVSAA